MHVPTLVAALAIVVVSAAIFGYIAQRIGLVSIVGYIVAGILVGPYALGFFVDDFALVEAMGEIGVIFLMFFIGLELGGDLLKLLYPEAASVNHLCVSSFWLGRVLLKQ